MKDTICCFAAQGLQKLLYAFDEGHPDCIKFILKLAFEIELVISNGCTTFITGADEWPEIWFSELVLDFQHAYPEKNIRLVTVLPYQKKNHRLSKTYSERYEQVISQANDVVIMGKQYYAGCVEERNHYMITESSHMIALLNGKNDSMQSMITYAKNTGTAITILNTDDFFKRRRKFLWRTI